MHCHFIEFNSTNFLGHTVLDMALVQDGHCHSPDSYTTNTTLLPVSVIVSFFRNKDNFWNDFLSNRLWQLEAALQVLSKLKTVIVFVTANYILQD